MKFLKTVVLMLFLINFSEKKLRSDVKKNVQFKIKDLITSSKKQRKSNKTTTARAAKNGCNICKKSMSTRLRNTAGCTNCGIRAHQRCIDGINYTCNSCQYGSTSGTLIQKIQYDYSKHYQSYVFVK